MSAPFVKITDQFLHKFVKFVQENVAEYGAHDGPLGGTDLWREKVTLVHVTGS